MRLAIIKECLKPCTLLLLCIMPDITNANSREEATAEALKEWLNNALAASEKDFSDCVDTALAAVEYHLVEGGPAGGFTNLILKYIRELYQKTRLQFSRTART